MIGDFWRGIVAYPKVLPLFTKLGLWKYVILTALIAIGLLVGLVVLGYLFASGTLFDPIAVPEGWPQWLGYSLPITIGVTTVAVGLLLFKHLLLIVAAPWMGPVATEVGAWTRSRLDRATIAGPVRSTPVLVARSVRLTTRLVTKELAWTLVFGLISLIPLVGLVGVVGLFVTQSYFGGAGALDYGMEKELSYKESLAFLRHSPGVAIGVGTGFVLLVFSIVGALVAPAWSVAAAAYAYEQKAAAARPGSR